MSAIPFAPVPAVSDTDLSRFQQLLRSEGMRGALGFLNARTAHRFTGIFRFDGEMLRSVELIDKWDASVARGEDVPLATAHCAHLQRTNEPLQVRAGPMDPRLPGMQDNPVVSYCGVPIEDAAGRPWGALCHFDLQPCEARASDMPLLLASGKLLADFLREAAP